MKVPIRKCLPVVAAALVAASVVITSDADARRGGGGGRAGGGGGGGARAGGGQGQAPQASNAKADARTTNVRSGSVNNVNVDRNVDDVDVHHVHYGWDNDCDWNRTLPHCR